MPDRYTPEEFEKLMAPWAAPERALAEQRLRTGFARETLEHFDAAQATALRSVLARLIPQQEGVDLAGFVDWAATQTFGRGDRAPGMPEEAELFRRGLDGLDETARALHGAAFCGLQPEQQDALLRQLADGSAPGAAWQALPAQYFFQRLYAKALHGYLAHPRVWMRIGFMGASYPEGYTWLSAPQVKQRHERAPGWDRL